MNVILIVSDTLRRDHLGCYGNDWISTPNLDRFAQGAHIFERAYLASFPTVPCRNDLFTGRYTFTYKPWAPIGEGETVLAEVLDQAGVVTALFADTPHPFTPGFNYQRGFAGWEIIRGQEHDRWKTEPAEIVFPCDPTKLRAGEQSTGQYLRNVAEREKEEDYFPARTMRAAAHWLERNSRYPFFLYIDTFDPHEPWDPPQHYTDLYDPGYEGEKVIYPRYDRCDFLTQAELNHCRALYAGEVSLVDRWVGHLLRRVEDLGLWNDTAVFVMSDHGFYLGEHGYIGKSLIAPEYQQALPLYPEVARIPLLAHLPNSARRRRIRAYAQPVDLMPTILELFGVPIPGAVQGRSLLTLLRGKRRAVRPFAVSSPTLSSPAIAAPHPTTRSTITSGDWTLIFGSQTDRITDPEMTRMVDGIQRQVRALERGPIRPELYHLPEDPACTRDVIHQHPDVARKLHADYVAFLKRAGMDEGHLRFLRGF